MPDYVILTDSSADLSAEMVREAGVTVLPLSFTIQGETYENTPDNRGDGPGAVLRYAPGGGAGHHLRRQCSGLHRYGGAPCFRRGRMCSSWPSPPGCPRPVIPAEVAAEELRERVSPAETLCGGYSVRLPGAGPAGLAGRPGAEEGTHH